MSIVNKDMKSLPARTCYRLDCVKNVVSALLNMWNEVDRIANDFRCLANTALARIFCKAAFFGT